MAQTRATTPAKVNGSRNTVDDGPKRAVIYLRQSQDFTEDGAAVERQLQDCERLCARNKWIVVGVYDDNDKSASGKRKRKHFDRMIADAKKDSRPFDVIVGQHMDRLTRTLRDFLPLQELAEHYGVGTTTVSGDIDLTTDMGQTLGGMLAVFANGEIKRKGARQTRANEQFAEKGLPSIGGSAPFGFRDEMVPVGKVKRRHRTVDTVTSASVRKAYESLLAGRSVSSIAKDLNDAGHSTMRGKPWTHHSVRGLLQAPRNAGLRAYKGEIVGPASWDPIVDEPTWRAAEAILKDPARRTTPRDGGTRKHLGVSLFQCGVCDDGTTMHTEIGGGNRRQYACKTGKHLFRVAEPIDLFVIDAIVERVSRDDALDLLVDADRPDLPALRIEATDLRNQLNDAAAERAEGILNAGEHRIISAGLKARLSVVETAMTHTDRAAVLADLVSAEDPLAAWKGYPLDRQRAIVNALCVVTVLKGRRGGNSRLAGTGRPFQVGTVTVAFHR